MVGNSNENGELDAVLLEALVDGLVPPRLTDSQRRILRERVLAVAAEAAPALTETVRGHDVPWKHAGSGVWMRVMRQDVSADLQIAVLRMEPGSRVPGHAHAKNEECLVVEGEILIGSHHLSQGDYHLAHAGAYPADITSPTGALLMVRSGIPGSRWPAE